MIRVAIIAASPAMRAGLRVVLDSSTELTLVGDAAPDDPERTPLVDADVVVAYRSVPAWLSASTTLVGVLLLSDETEALERLQSSSLAWGVVPEDATPGEIVAGVQSLAQGLIVVHPAFAGRVLAPASALLDAAAEPLDAPLTAREHEVLQWLGQGLSNRQIALRLDISEHTVKFHVSAVYAKLGVASRAEAVRVAARRGLLVL